MNKKYITTAIPYVNAAPHIGFALEAVYGDAIARYFRLKGADTLLAFGSDENSLKNVQAAEKEGVETKVLVDKYAKAFEDLKGALNLSWDIFNRTSDEHHFLGAQKLWSLCKKEDIYKKKYKGLYCVGCELFYTPGELIDGKCPEHKTVPDEVEEENYFFKLSNYQEYLADLIKTDKLRVVPETRKNEVLSFIKSGLEDFSISRSVERARGWGVPVPGDDSQVMYVWFDALTTYLTSLGFGTDDEKQFKEYWEDNGDILQIIGKGIVRFHAIYWPAMLESAGIRLPKELFVHGYITVNGEKISKSLGNTIDPYELTKKYGIDPVRFYLLREIPSHGDGDFSETRFVEIYNGELANGLGNLVARVAKLAEGESLSGEEKGVDFWKEIDNFLVDFEFDQALKFIWTKVSDADKYLNEKQPWKLEGGERVEVLNKVISEICDIAFNLKPFLPETADKILEQFTGKIRVETSLFPRLS